MRFARFLSSGFIKVIVVNPPEKKLAKRTSVHCAIAMQAYQTQGRIKLPGILLTKYRKVLSINTSRLMTCLVYKHQSAILAIFQTGPEWPCPVGTALKNPSLDFKKKICFGFL